MNAAAFAEEMARCCERCGVSSVSLFTAYVGLISAKAPRIAAESLLALEESALGPNN
jgi:hypothetical protein